MVKIVSSSWRNIIHDKKQAKEAKLGKEPEPEPTGFFLDFGDNPAPIEPKEPKKAKGAIEPKKSKVEPKTDPTPTQDQPIKPDKKEKKKKKTKED